MQLLPDTSYYTLVFLPKQIEESSSIIQLHHKNVIMKFPASFFPAKKNVQDVTHIHNISRQRAIFLPIFVFTLQKSRSFSIKNCKKFRVGISDVW